jgi:mRNA interferase RelE/StbE
MLNVSFSNQAEKYLKKLDKETIRRILKKIDKLSENPFIQDTKRIEGTPYFRVRIGKQRIMYEVDKGNNFLGIVKIDKRERVYD